MKKNDSMGQKDGTAPHSMQRYKLMGTNTTVPTAELCDKGRGGGCTLHSQMNRSGVAGKRRHGKERTSHSGSCDRL